MSRWIHRFMLMIGCAIVTFTGTAQDITEPITYTWDAADLTLIVPDTWEPPVIMEAEFPTLELAQAFAGDLENRAPAIPFIRLVLFPPETFSLVTVPLDRAFRDLGLRPIGPFPAGILGNPGMMVVGSDADDLLYGIGMVVQLPSGEILLILGRTSAERRAEFGALIDRFNQNLSNDPNLTAEPVQYGVRWHTERLATDGEDAFLDLRGLTVGDSNHLYVLDEVVGVLTVDTHSGEVLERLPLPDEGLPTDITRTPDGTLYVSDLLCSCIHVARAGVWVDRIDGFNLDAPQQLAVSSDGTLYATDQDEQVVYLHAFSATGEDSMLFFEDPLQDQPLLATNPAGELRVISLDGVVYQVEGVGFTPLFELQEPPAFPNGAAFDNRGQLLVASGDAGLVVFDAAGEPINQIGQFAQDIPRPGDLIEPQDVAVAGDRTVYWVDGDASSGNITAASPNIQPDRVGESLLVPGAVVQGTLNDENTLQIWTFDGVSGQIISLNALAFPDERDFPDLALVLFSPDGREVASNDNHEGDVLIEPTDARISNYRLDRDGVYVVLVLPVEGSGRYQLGFSTPRPVDVSSGEAQISGRLSDALPVQDWVFEASAGEILTITMEAESGSIDPLLKLRTARGDVFAENDNADDPALGVNAQLVEVRIPATGTYTLSAGRFLGEGRYTLTIMVD